MRRFSRRRALSDLRYTASRCLIVIVLVQALALRCACAADNDTQARILKIKADVAVTEKTIATLKNEYTALSKERKNLEANVKSLSVQEQHLLDRSQALSREKEQLAHRVHEAEERVAQQQGKIRQRLRALYMNTKMSTEASLLLSTQGVDIERVAVYAHAVRKYDDRRFEEVKSAVVELVQARVALEQAFQEAQKLQEDVSKKRAESQAEVSKLLGVMEQIKQRKQAAQNSLVALYKEASKLEEVLRLITSRIEEKDAGGGVPSVVTASPSEDARVSGEGSTDGSPRRTDAVMHPEGLFGKTVRVVAPVEGQVLQKFGKNKVTEFADMVFSKGQEYVTTEGTKVRAVLGGRVAFAGAMPGYETIVIIDHGLRSYSLYGRLGKALVTKGDFVARGDTVGVTGPPDGKRRNFYFETRRNGAPVDPADVLSRAG